MNITVADMEKELDDTLKDNLKDLSKGTSFTPKQPAMAKATTIVKLDQTIADLQQNIEEMQAMIRVVEEIKKRLV